MKLIIFSLVVSMFFSCGNLPTQPSRWVVKGISEEGYTIEYINKLDLNTPSELVYREEIHKYEVGDTLKLTLDTTFSKESGRFIVTEIRLSKQNNSMASYKIDRFWVVDSIRKFKLKDTLVMTKQEKI